jgi:hypothetical protein
MSSRMIAEQMAACHWLQQEATQSPPPNVACMATGVHPDEVALNTNLEHVVADLQESERCQNTQKAHDPKMLEFFAFCDLLYPDDPYMYILCCKKVYRFMWYQCFCKKKKSGGDKEKIARGEYFNLEAYKDLMREFRAGPSHAQIVFPTPKHPIAICTSKQYKAVFQKLYKVQKMERVLSLNWDNIWQLPFKDLHKNVKEQQPKLQKETYQEKVSANFSTYTIVEWYGDIENKLWNDSHQG